jgi:glutamate-1-semialdehyde aminotransferase
MVQKQIDEQLVKFADRFRFTRMGSVFSVQPLSQQENNNFDLKKYSKIHTWMLQQGYLMTPSPYETMYISHAHNNENILKFVGTLEKSFEYCLWQSC